MFDFQKLTVYQKAKDFHNKSSALIKSHSFDRITNDQLKRASLSIMLNIAEGTARTTRKDRRHFYVIARGSAFECAAIIDQLADNQAISTDQKDALFADLEELSKMLFALIGKLGEYKKMY